MMREHTPLCTLSRLGVQNLNEKDFDVKAVATTWFSAFAAAAEAGDVQAVSNLFIDQSIWRDILALTWDFRTFQDLTRITQFLSDRLSMNKLGAFRIREDTILLERQFEDTAWIRASFEFETNTGICSGILRLVPLPSGEWKAYSMFTHLEDLKGFPEKLGPLRNMKSNHGKWEENRTAKAELKDVDPTVLIIGGGQSGLGLAARLDCLGVSNLVIEKNARIGDNWRERYDALCLHDPVWYDHMPYFPFPATWPAFTPSRKLANWLEAYAEALEINVWVSSTVSSARKDNKTGEWIVSINRNSSERTFRCKHLVFATGLTPPGDPVLPDYPGQDLFKGQRLHSTRHKRADDHAGKKVVVVGACTSAHDICADYANHGIDVTMVQRSSTYIMSVMGFKKLFAGLYWEDGPDADASDRINASLPNLMNIEISQRIVKSIAEDDKEILDGLKRVGFRTNLGGRDAGFFPLAWTRAGGYYLDTGASQYIIDGKIKLKNDAQISSFTPSGLKFEDGSELQADVVVFSTGVGNAGNYVYEILDEDSSRGFTGIWGLNEEGELIGTWRDCGVERMWFMIGNLSLCRFHSKHLALQIKAIEEGVFGSRYSL